MAKKSVIKKATPAKAKAVVKKPIAKKTAAKKVIAKKPVKASSPVKAVKTTPKKAAVVKKVSAKPVLKKSTPVKKAAVKKNNAPTFTETIITIETLPSSSLLNNFVNKYAAQWDHDAWLELCEELASIGINPADFDRVGLILEDLKSEFLKNR